jgi:MbtH protein
MTDDRTEHSGGGTVVAIGGTADAAGDAGAPDGDAGDTVYTVILGGDDTIALWPADRPVPDGWREIGVRGSRRACVDALEAAAAEIGPSSTASANRRPGGH